MREIWGGGAPGASKSCCSPLLPDFMRLSAEPRLMVTLAVIHGNAGGSDSVGLYFWLNFSFTLDEINLMLKED